MSEETYVRERNCLIDIEQKSADQHDKAILTLASGALALSITFLEKIAANPAPNTLWMIGISWLCFILSILTILSSFLMSQWACRRQRDILDAEYLNREPQDQTNRAAKATGSLTFVSYIFFVVGMAFLAFFSWSNLPPTGASRMPNGTGVKSTTVQPTLSTEPDQERGTVPPKSPATPKPIPSVPAPAPADKK